MVWKLKIVIRNGFSLVESIISLVIISIIIGSILFSLQSHRLFSMNKDEQIKDYNLSSNVYSEYIIEYKLNDKTKTAGKSLMLPYSDFWQASIEPTIFLNINRFKIWLTDSKKEKKPLKTEYYFYANTE
jgi:prepilin-type N-terminal cleavage/methylation domain-containing protein